MYEEGSPEFKVQKVGQGYAKQLLEAGKDADSFYKGRILGLNNGKEILKVGADVVGGTLTKPLYEILIRELPQKYRPDFREQKLTGGQVKLDVNDDGTLTADDFKALRERTQKQMGGIMEGEALPTQEEQMQSMMSDKTESEKMQEELEPLPEEPKEEIEMESDEEMEESYLDFIINEALSEEEEEMLMNELENNPELSMLFDKVMDVATEFSGSGPVEGPGSEVSDSIPARLSDGEFVFTTKAVEEIGADNLMSMMKEAEAKADERLTAANGGEIEEETGLTPMPVETPAIKQDIRVTKETVGSQATMQEEDDLVSDEIKKSMLSNRPYVRS
tara:strand:- start:102 stop:1100 length:999 start_codon:yes stop_codon:yes gene_type:complete